MTNSTKEMAFLVAKIVSQKGALGISSRKMVSGCFMEIAGVIRTPFKEQAIDLSDRVVFDPRKL